MNFQLEAKPSPQSAITCVKAPPITARENPTVSSQSRVTQRHASRRWRISRRGGRPLSGKSGHRFFLVDVQLSRKEINHFTIGKAPPNVITAILVAELFCIGEVLMSCRGQSCLILLRHNRLTRGLVRSADYQCLSPAFHHPLMWITKSEHMNARRAIIPK